MQRIQHTQGIWTIPGFWSRMACFEMIQKSEALGSEEAKVDTGKGQRVVKEVRSNDRVLFTTTLWQSSYGRTPTPYP